MQVCRALGALWLDFYIHEVASGALPVAGLYCLFCFALMKEGLGL